MVPYVVRQNIETALGDRLVCVPSQHPYTPAETPPPPPPSPLTHLLRTGRESALTHTHTGQPVSMVTAQAEGEYKRSLSSMDAGGISMLAGWRRGEARGMRDGGEGMEEGGWGGRAKINKTIDRKWNNVAVYALRVKSLVGKEASALMKARFAETDK